MDSISSFSTEPYPGSLRADAWRSAIADLSLRLNNVSKDQSFRGTARTIVSPLGISIAHIASGPQEFAGCGDESPDSAWLMLLLAGKAKLKTKSGDTSLAPGDFAYGGLRDTFQITMSTEFQQCFIIIPRELLRARLFTALIDGQGSMCSDAGPSRILADMLRSVVDTIDQLSPEDLRPVEIAMNEFLATCLASQSSSNIPRGATGNQISILNRICQHIEARLGEHDLSRADVARMEGITPRYLQKLFENAGETFGHYLRLRRLTRCRADLADPKYEHLSITEICYGAGFNDSAHFSRAFREQYGESPRSYRKRARMETTADPYVRERGWPKEADSVLRRVASSQAHEWARHSTFRSRRRHSNAGKTSSSNSAGRAKVATRHHFLPANEKTVHWGYFSKSLPPVVTVKSGELVTIETLTHHAADDIERMVTGDPGAESVFRWTSEGKSIDRRGAGPLDASVCGRGAGEGFGVHLCTGPIAIAGAEPGDVVEVRILDVEPRPSANDAFAGRSFGSNAAAWWGYHYNDLLTEPKPREVITIYEIDWDDGHYARAAYNFRWTPQRDPSGVLHPTIDYPGVPVDHATVEENHDVLKGVRIPLRPHFGVIGLAPKEAEIVDSIPPSYFGGNLDNWRAGPGTAMFLPVSVPGGLLSVGDPHASQGDSELCGTAIECSLTGTFQIVLHKKPKLAGKPIADLDYPLLETQNEWVVHGFSNANYLAELGEGAQSEIYKRSSLDPAMRDAFWKMRRFLMTSKGLTEDEAISLISVSVDFGVTQVVDGNWCVHALLRKDLFHSESGT